LSTIRSGKNEREGGTREQVPALTDELCLKGRSVEAKGWEP